ncbi:MAG TPA: PQQ-binding-like beta-propeller repeat protein [Polyangiaceae bacterium]|nr:PQQ-binding-like beta-propeller repeat protein [Polyangiaceae bacterium]
MLGLRFGCLALALLGASVARAEPRTVFHFSASSSLFARPGVGQGGAVYIGSGDGYVHALAADGTFRWSYTVKGRVVAPPVEEAASGRVFVATSESKLYALEADSHLRWVFPLPVAPKSELSLTPKGTLYFVGQDDALYGVTTGGALTLRIAATAARSAPVLLEGGQTALVLGDSVATLKGYGYARAALPGVFDAAAKLALGADGAVFACENGLARVVSGSATAPLLELESDCLSPPVRGDGFFAIAEATGDVRLVQADGQSGRIALGASPLRPIWDAARRRLVLSTATGSVTALELPGPP